MRTPIIKYKGVNDQDEGSESCKIIANFFFFKKKSASTLPSERDPLNIKKQRC